MMRKTEIDYSKWDKLEVSDDEDDSDNEEGPSNKPSVTRFDQPQVCTLSIYNRDVVS
jgi:hypothetical protein